MQAKEGSHATEIRKHYKKSC